MSGPGYPARRARLLRHLKHLKVDSLLISGVSNVRYLTGFTGDSTWLYLSADDAILLSDTRYETQLKQECGELASCIRDAGKTMFDIVAGVVPASDTRVAVEADHLTLAEFRQLSSKIPQATFVSTQHVVEQLREIKDKWEVTQIRAAIRIAERGLAVVRSMLRPQLTERDVRYILEEAMRSFGAVGPAFEPIVGVGPTGALPHAHAGSRRIEDSPALLIDWGALTDSGYRSDLTRVLFTGRPGRQMQQVYEVVLEAQQQAIQSIRPGVACRDVDRTARDVIAAAGYGKLFGHGLGHGFGLDIHESARMSPLSEHVFQPGMVITVEPGIYLPGKFGIRIEDDVLVTPDGHEVLSTVHRDFESAILPDLA